MHVHTIGISDRRKRECYLVLLRRVHVPEAAEASVRPAADEAVSLQALVILDVFGELAERVAGGRALGASEEGHGGCGVCRGQRCAGDGEARCDYKYGTDSRPLLRRE